MLNGRFASAASAALVFCALASTAHASDVYIAVAGPMSGNSAAFWRANARWYGGRRRGIERLGPNTRYQSDVERRRRRQRSEASGRSCQ